MKRRQFLHGFAAAGGTAVIDPVAFFDKSLPVADTLMIAGSSAMTPYLRTLCDSFRQKRPRARLLLEGGGSTPGLAAVRRGAIDLAAVSRHLTRAEDDEQVRSWLVAMDAIALVVHPSNPVAGVRDADLVAIFEGQIDNWSALGGRDRPITVVHRASPESTTRRSLDELVLHYIDVTARTKLVDGYKDMISAVAADPDAIGYVALRDVGAGLKALDVDGVPLSRASILTGRYPYCRPFYLVSAPECSAIAQAFLDFTRSDAGQAVLGETGLVRVG